MLMTIRNGSKSTIFDSGGVRLLQMVLEPTRTLGSHGGWIVRFLIGWRGEPSISYKDVETSP